MMITTQAEQTRTAQGTPSAIMHYMSDSSLNRPSREISRIVTGLTDNKFPQLGTNPALVSTNDRIGRLYELGENWNGYHVSAPNPKAIEHALAWIQSAHSKATRNGLEWLSPHVTADEEGNVVFEWWKGEKKLTVYISPTDISFVKVWGTNINTEMAEGNISTLKDYLKLWSWTLE